MDIPELLTLFTDTSSTIGKFQNNGIRGKEDSLENFSLDKEILDRLPAFIHIIQAQSGDTIWRNAEWNKLIPAHDKMSKQEIDRALKKCIHPDDFSLLTESTRFFKTTKEEAFGGIIRVKYFKEKKWRWLIGISKTILQEENGNPLYNLAIFVDFTLATQSNAQIAQVLREILSNSHKKTLDKLTKREKEILQLLVKGHKNRQIAEELFISQHTVETHRKNLRLKLDVKNTPELISLAKDLGL